MSKDGRDYNKAIRSGKVRLNEDGMEFIDNSNPRAGFTIKDYDSLHLINCREDNHKCLVTLYGRKMKAEGVDVKNCQDPMEAL